MQQKKDMKNYGPITKARLLIKLQRKRGKQMPKVIDISSQLTNARPKIKISEDKEYTVNDRKNTIILVNALFKNQKEDVEDLEIMDKALDMLIGKEARKEIDELDLSFAAYQKVFTTAMSAATGTSEEEIEGRAKGK